MMNKALLTTAICFAACMPAWASNQDDAALSLKTQSAQEDDSDILNYGKADKSSSGTATLEKQKPKEDYSDILKLADTEVPKPKEATSNCPLKGNARIDMKEKIKPLDPLLCPGNYFDEKVATALLKDQSVNTSIWKKDTCMASRRLGNHSGHPHAYGQIYKWSVFPRYHYLGLCVEKHRHDWLAKR